MSDDDWDDDWADYARDEYEFRLIQDAISEQSTEQVSSYLGTFGDAVNERVQAALDDARILADEGRYGLSVTRSAAATELIVRFLLLRPLVQGAFLSDEWADILTKRVIGGRSAEDRDLLPAVARAWEIDLLGARLSNGRPMWETITTELWPRRHQFVHAGTPLPEDIARRGVEIVELMLSDFVAPMAARFQLSWPATRWSNVDGVPMTGGGRMSRRYEARSPFSV